MTYIASNSTYIFVYILEILPLLVYSLFIETRFASRRAVILYGIQAIIFAFTSLILSPIISSNLGVLFVLFVLGLIWLYYGINLENDSNVIGSFKTLAAIQIPIVLYGYQFLFFKDLNNTFWIILLLLALFHSISFLISYFRTND